MEEIACKKDHVDVMFGSETQDFVEGSAAVVAADGIALVVAYMVVGSNEDTDRIRICETCQFHPSWLDDEQCYEPVEVGMVSFSLC